MTTDNPAQDDAQTHAENALYAMFDETGLPTALLVESEIRQAADRLTWSVFGEAGDPEKVRDVIADVRSQHGPAFGAIAGAALYALAHYIVNPLVVQAEGDGHDGADIFAQIAAHAQVSKQARRNPPA
ncbi:hypothetical protein [Rhodococcus sp. B10]|uniref:hypothetical protein n=1 Tax=Rhodococcus sp. B10 TaxID=2695876 RepID=UPI0014321B6B|nr:hypothetical protein [Rhodococcus sp. B10]NIL74417.1 hypothetical protein [Rhodococcus sp. B10]